MLLSPCMVMRYGLDQLRPKIGEVKRVMLSGGVLKSKGGYGPQLIADILGTPVVARAGDEEGTAIGAAILAAYMNYIITHEEKLPFDQFLKSTCKGEEILWQPDEERHAGFNQRYQRFLKYLQQLQTERHREDSV